MDLLENIGIPSFKALQFYANFESIDRIARFKTLDAPAMILDVNWVTCAAMVSIIEFHKCKVNDNSEAFGFIHIIR